MTHVQGHTATPSAASACVRMGPPCCVADHSAGQCGLQGGDSWPLRTLTRGLSVWPHVTEQTGAGTVRRDEHVLGNSRGSRGGAAPKPASPGAPTSACPRPAWRPFSLGLGRGRRPPVTALAMHLGPAAAQDMLGQHAPRPGPLAPPAAACIASSVPRHRGGLNRLGHRVWTQDASRSWPTRPLGQLTAACMGSPGLVPSNALDSRRYLRP